MEHSRKFVLVPEDRLQQFAEDHLSELDMQMQTILNKKDLTDSEKSTLYLQILQKYVKFPTSEFLKEKPAVTLPQTEILPVDKVLDLDKDIIDAVPVKLKSLASDIIHFIREKDISWSHGKELIVKGKMIPNTNIVSLISDVLRNRKKRPHGHKIFYDMLKEINFPTKYVKNKFVIPLFKVPVIKLKRKTLPSSKVRTASKMYAKPNDWIVY